VDRVSVQLGNGIELEIKKATQKLDKVFSFPSAKPGFIERNFPNKISI